MTKIRVANLASITLLTGFTGYSGVPKLQAISSGGHV